MDIKSRLQILTGDIFGGLNSAIVALPQALAFGVATGFGAGAGIWGAIILCFVAGLLGSKIPMISGPTGPMTIVVASVAASLSHDMHAVGIVIMFAALFQLLFSVTSISDIVKYVPYPVISGFMNGVGIIIILLQLNPLIGYPAVSNSFEGIKSFILNLNSINIPAFALGMLTLLIVFGVPKKINKYVPSQIIALIFCTLISIKLGLDVPKISEITVGFPKIEIPVFNLSQAAEYIPYALTLAIVLSAESMLTGLVADSLTKSRHNPKTLLFSQGLGNVACALTGSLCGTAATMRTVAALNAGATTKLAAVINPVILCFLLFKFSGFVAEIPLAVLAGILIKIGYDIIDVKLLKVLKFAPKDDLYVLALVFLLTVFYNLIFAVGAGITLAALLYAKRVADKANIVQKSVYDKDIMKLEKILETDYEHKIRVVHITGQFFFGSATQLISKFEDVLGTKCIIINYEADDLLDISAIFALEDIIIRLKSQHIKILMVIKNEQVLNQLSSHSIISQIGEDKIFYNELDAIEFAKNSLKQKAKNKKILNCKHSAKKEVI